MSTMKTIQLIVQERDALAMAFQALNQVINVRGLQVVEHSNELEIFRKDTIETEKRLDCLSEQLDGMCVRHDIDRDAAPDVLMLRLDGMINRLNDELREAKRYGKLVQLCMKGRRALKDDRLLGSDTEREIVAEVERLRAEEMPF